MIQKEFDLFWTYLIYSETKNGSYLNLSGFDAVQNTTAFEMVFVIKSHVNQCFPIN